MTSPSPFFYSVWIFFVGLVACWLLPACGDFGRQQKQHVIGAGDQLPAAWTHMMAVQNSSTATAAAGWSTNPLAAAASSTPSAAQVARAGPQDSHVQDERFVQVRPGGQLVEIGDSKDSSASSSPWETDRCFSAFSLNFSDSEKAKDKMRQLCYTHTLGRTVPVVDVYDIRETRIGWQTTLHFLMEKKNQTLEEWMRQDSRGAWAKAKAKQIAEDAFILFQIVESIQRLLSQNFVHGYINVKSVLVRTTDESTQPHAQFADIGDGGVAQPFQKQIRSTMLQRAGLVFHQLVFRKGYENMKLTNEALDQIKPQLDALDANIDLIESILSLMLKEVDRTSEENVPKVVEKAKELAKKAAEKANLKWNIEVAAEPTKGCEVPKSNIMKFFDGKSASDCIRDYELEAAYKAMKKVCRQKGPTEECYWGCFSVMSETCGSNGICECDKDRCYNAITEKCDTEEDFGEVFSKDELAELKVTYS